MGRLKKLKKIRIHREGTHILWASFLLLLLINAALYWGIDCKIPFYVVAVASIAVYLLMVNFFRCPIRLFGKDTEKIVVAPADGKIVVIEETFEKEYFRDNRLQISIFMSPFNMHSNRYPISGTVTWTNYQPGKKFHARSPKSSELNERSSVVVKSESGTEILVRQVAGAVARRIVTYSRKGAQVKQGEELGFIKFGSRVDIFLPTDTVVDVQMFEQVRASRTILARVI